MLYYACLIYVHSIFHYLSYENICGYSIKDITFYFHDENVCEGLMVEFEITKLNSKLIIRDCNDNGVRSQITFSDEIKDVFSKAWYDWVTCKRDRMC